MCLTTLKMAEPLNLPSVDSCGPKEARVQWHSPSWEGTLVPRLNHPSAAAMQPYVKLRSPFVIDKTFKCFPVNLKPR